MKGIRNIKGFESTIAKLESEITIISKDIDIKSNEIRQKREEINRLKQRIRQINNDGVVKVSEHAMLRYLERIKGINIEEIENEIKSKTIVDLIERLGDGIYPSDNRFFVKVKNNTIVTITVK